MIFNCVLIKGFPSDASEADVLEFIKPHGRILHIVLPEPGTARIEFAETGWAEALLLAAKASPLQYNDLPLVVTAVASAELTKIIHYRGLEKSVSWEDLDRVLLQKVVLMKYLYLYSETSFDLYIEFPDRSSAVTFIENFDAEELGNEFGSCTVGYTLLDDLFDTICPSLQLAICITDRFIENSEELDAVAAPQVQATQPVQAAQPIQAPQDLNRSRNVECDDFLNGTLALMGAVKEQMVVSRAFMSNQAAGVILYGKSGLGKRIRIHVDGNDVHRIYRRGRDLNPGKLRDVFKIAANLGEPALVVILDVMGMEPATTAALIQCAEVMSSDRNPVWIIGSTTEKSVVGSELSKKFTTIFLAELTDH